MPVKRLRAWWAEDRATRAAGERALAQARRPADWATRVAYGFRLAWHRRAHRRLLQHLGSHPLPAVRAMWQANPLLGFKVLHPCHVSGLDAEARVDRVIAHHEALHALLGEAGYRQAQAARGGLGLGPLPGLAPLQLRLDRHPRFWREGELTLALCDGDGALRYSLTFSLGPSAAGAAGGRHLLIGSLIGVAPMEEVRRLTKACQGLRPQAMLVAAAQSLARAWGLDGIEAVGRGGHVFARTDRADRLQFDYDAFWRELGGEPVAADGRLWRLPLAPQRRDEAEVPSHKRAQYRRRYAWLDALDAALREGLARAGAPAQGPASGSV